VTVYVCMLFSCSWINSVAHQLSWFGVGFSPCLIPGGLFLCLAPFPWGKVSDPSASPLLSVCCDGLLIIFQFCIVIWLLESRSSHCLVLCPSHHLGSTGPFLAINYNVLLMHIITWINIKYISLREASFGRLYTAWFSLYDILK
jgi:hypothetical protein